MRNILKYLKEQIPLEIRRPLPLLSIIVALIASGFLYSVGEWVFKEILKSVSPYMPGFIEGLFLVLTHSWTININIISIIAFVVAFFTLYRFVYRKILQGLGTVTTIFEDDFNAGNKGWALNYWGSNNADKTCHYENSALVFEGTDNDLVDSRKENGAYFDLTDGIYEEAKYIISCWVKSEGNATIGFKLWIHDREGHGNVKFPANFYTPGNNYKEVKIGFTATKSQALRIHLHYKAGAGRILVDKVKVVKVK